MRRTHITSALAVFLCFALTSVPAIAFATDTVSVTAAAPSAGGGPASAIEIQMWPSEAEGSSVIVSAEIPTDAQLPYTLRLPMPAGITITWCGEVFVGDPQKDREVAYTLEDGRGGKALVMTLTTSRTAQYEGTLAPPTQTGQRWATALEWIQSAPAGQEHFAVKTANTAGDPQIDPVPEGQPRENTNGERLYSLPTQTLPLGQAYKVSVSWTIVAARIPTAQPTTAAGGITDVVLVVLIGALAIAVVALIVVAARSGRADGSGVIDVPTQPAETGSRAKGRSADGEHPRGDGPPEDDPFGDLD
jgi:hypothetical protein